MNTILEFVGNVSTATQTLASRIVPTIIPKSATSATAWLHERFDFIPSDLARIFDHDRLITGGVLITALAALIYSIRSAMLRYWFKCKRCDEHQDLLMMIANHFAELNKSVGKHKNADNDDHDDDDDDDEEDGNDKDGGEEALSPKKRKKKLQKRILKILKKDHQSSGDENEASPPDSGEEKAKNQK